MFSEVKNNIRLLLGTRCFEDIFAKENISDEIRYFYLYFCLPLGVPSAVLYFRMEDMSKIMALE